MAIRLASWNSTSAIPGWAEWLGETAKVPSPSPGVTRRNVVAIAAPAIIEIQGESPRGGGLQASTRSWRLTQKHAGTSALSHKGERDERVGTALLNPLSVF